MKKIISYSLWGENPKYSRGALINADLSSKFYHGWIARYYVDDTVPSSLIYQLKIKGAEIVQMPRSIGTRGALWRFLPGMDLDVSHFISRDCDSRFTFREIAAVKEWINSGLDFHVMKDHPRHRDNVMAGMWGCTNAALMDIGELLSKWPSSHTYYSQDQRFIDQYLFLRIRRSCLMHNDLSRDNVKFPLPMKGYKFVGLQYDEYNIPDYETMIERAQAHTGRELSFFLKSVSFA